MIVGIDSACPEGLNVARKKKLRDQKKKLDNGQIRVILRWLSALDFIKIASCCH